MSASPLIPVAAPAHRPAVWISAAALAAAFHLAFVVFAIARMRDDAPEDDFGAPGIEVAFEVTSPQTAPSDLPPGLESEASVAAPPAVKQDTTDHEVTLPKDTPVETPEPARIVTADNSPTPNEKEPEPQAKKTVASDESVAHEAMATPSVAQVPQAAKSTTRDQGTGESLRRARITWQKELLAHLDKFKRYPADRSGMSAEIQITLNLDRNGRVLSATISKSSGDQAFDAAAIAMVERASPVPAPPPLIADEGLTFVLPVKFRMHASR